VNRSHAKDAKAQRHTKDALKQRLHILDRATEHCTIPALDNRPLNQVRMLDHQSDEFIIAQFAFTRVEFAIDRFARAQKLAGLKAHLLEQLAQLLFAQRLDVIVDLFEIDATLTE
jgi:hypothetical protein